MLAYFVQSSLGVPVFHLLSDEIYMYNPEKGRLIVNVYIFFTLLFLVKFDTFINLCVFMYLQ